jgi:type III secretion system YscQ/HrcQ family protein
VNATLSPKTAATRASTVRPFPYASLTRWSRADVGVVRSILRRLPSDAELTSAAQTARELLGTAPRLGPEVPRFATFDAVTDPFMGVAFVHPDGRRAVVELDARLAACVIDRVLGGEGGASVPPFAAPPDALPRGVLLYFAARLSTGVDGWLVAGVVDSAEAARTAIAPGPLVRFESTAWIGDDRGRICLWMDGASDVGPHRVRPGDTLPNVSVTMTLNAAHGTLRTAEVAGLERGDIVVLDRSLLERARPLAGKLELCAAGSRRTTWTMAVEGSALRCVDEITTPSRVPTAGRKRHEGSSMTEPTPPEPTPTNRSDSDAQTEARASGAGHLIDKVGDTPIDLTLEVARFTMSLEEIAHLRPGEVLASGQRIGDVVTLRAGARVVALGELVDVDGEVGIRIVSLAE